MIEFIFLFLLISFLTLATCGFFLNSFIKNKNLVEDLEKQPDVSFYTECIQAYRKKNYEII